MVIKEILKYLCAGSLIMLAGCASESGKYGYGAVPRADLRDEKIHGKSRVSSSDQAAPATSPKLNLHISIIMKRTIGILISIVLAGCATAPQSHLTDAAVNSEIDWYSKAARAYIKRTTPQQRLADQQRYTLSQIASNQQQMLWSQQQAVEQQRKFYQNQEWNQQMDNLRQSEAVQAAPQYYQGHVNEDGSVQLYGY
jgi:hypothetical protein